MADFILDLDKNLEQDLKLISEATGLSLGQVVELLIRGETKLSDGDSEEIIKVAAQEVASADKKKTKDHEGDQVISEKKPEATVISTILKSKQTKPIMETTFAGSIAVILLVILAGIVHWNIQEVSYVSKGILDFKLEELNDENTSLVLERAEKSSSIISDTAKSLYSVFVPIAAAATTFYFGSRRKGEENKILIEESEDKS